MNNFTGLTRPELRRMATYPRRASILAAAMNEIMRRELAGETDMRHGRRLAGDDHKINAIRDLFNGPWL